MKYIQVSYFHLAIKLILCFTITNISSNSYACSCNLCSEEEYYDHAAKVFLGKLASESRTSDGELKFIVIESFKGSVESTELVKTGVGGGDCGLEIDMKSEYLIYVGGGWANICNGSFRASMASEYMSFHSDEEISSRQEFIRINDTKLKSLRMISESKNDLHTDNEQSQSQGSTVFICKGDTEP